jgi:hypothetical protein
MGRSKEVLGEEGCGTGTGPGSVHESSRTINAPDDIL